MARVKPLSYENLEAVGAVDIAYSGHIAVAAYAELEVRTGRLSLLAARASETQVDYRSGFLAFREAGPILGLLRERRVSPSVILVDGHGLAHPRLCGFATHLGVVTGLPTIGVAKGPIGPMTSSFNRLLCERFGRFFVSPGNLISLQDCLDIINRLPTRYGYPEPLGSAHNESKRALEREVRKKG